MTQRSIPFFLFASLLVAGGCSSISDSISSPFKSSSASSESSESREAKFHRDVEDYTAAFARGNGDFDVFMGGISDLASKRGITNWQTDTQTYVAIGRGLKKAKADTGQLEAYVANVAKGDATKAAAIRQGYSQ